MIVQTSDFTVNSFIPNVKDTPFYDILGNEDVLKDHILKYEKEVLYSLLGVALYTELVADMRSDGSFLPTADPKYVELVNGKDNYLGLKKLLVPYICYKFIENDDSHYSSSGVVKEISDTSVRFESRPKAIEQYREFYKYAIGAYYYSPSVFKVPSIWGDLKAVMWTGSPHRSNIKSLYQYMEEKKTTFTNWEPESFERKNYFDI